MIGCVLRHPTGGPSAKPNAQRPSPKKPRLDKAKPVAVGSTEPPPPITEHSYPVHVVGRVTRHYQSKQIYADTIDPCRSSLNEIAHLERVIELHKTKYSHTVPFFLPPKSTSHPPPLDTSTPHAGADADAGIFSDPSLLSCPDPSTASYALPAPPHMPMPQLKPTSIHTDTHPLDVSWTHTFPPRPQHRPSRPRHLLVHANHPVPPKHKRHHGNSNYDIRRVYTRDLTGNTFKHYMDNATPPFPISLSSPSRGTCGGVTIPTKHARDESEGDEPTPRPRPSTTNVNRNGEEDGDVQTLGFTLSHLRRVPELALLAARVIHAEARKRDKADREKEREKTRIISSTSGLLRSNGIGNGSTPTRRTGTGAVADLPRKKMTRSLFSWAVVKLYEERSIALWDGDVRPLPVPPPSEPWNAARSSTIVVPSASCCAPPTTSASASSAPALLYSHHHAPRQPAGRDDHHEGSQRESIDADADTAYLSDPTTDEEAYVPLTPHLLAGYVREAVCALRGGRGRGSRETGISSADVGTGTDVNGWPRGGTGGTGREPTTEDVLAYIQRADGRWARVGVWAVEEASAVLKAE